MVCVCLSVCLSVCAFIYLSVCLSACLCICVSVCVNVYLPICLSVYLPLCLYSTLYLFVCVSVCLSVCLSLVVRFPGLFRICEPLFLFSVSLHCSYSISHNICIVYMLLMKDWVVFLLCPNVVGHQDIHIIWAMSIILT